ncbi:hypothetical protein THAR02_10703 [Trichoderma harzianum]|uniref:Uncharacterized protein n=1 Tax=Trichoderma harzianum TaxID=5544 RepID=A0A0F9ZVN1_TRIHA|nr:hypothetical protein THAR02_10703 [Trichoderma harzianum]
MLGPVPPRWASTGAAVQGVNMRGPAAKQVPPAAAEGLCRSADAWCGGETASGTSQVPPHRFCQPRPGLFSSSFCTCRSIAMPQIAVKDRLVKLIAEGGGGMPCNDARGLRFSTGGLRSGSANNAHKDSLGAISFCAQWSNRVSFVLHTGSMNSYAATSKLKHLTVPTEQNRTAPYSIDYRSMSKMPRSRPWNPAPSGGGETSVPGAALPMQVFVLLP